MKLVVSFPERRDQGFIDHAATKLKEFLDDPDARVAVLCGCTACVVDESTEFQIVNGPDGAELTKMEESAS